MERRLAAVEYATAWQVGVDGPTRFRIGIHLGDVIARDDDLLGDSINVDARLEALEKEGLPAES